MTYAIYYSRNAFSPRRCAYALTATHHFFVLFLSGPPTPSSVNVSLERSNGVAGLSVSWEYVQDVNGSIEYFVTSNQNRNCSSTSSSCTLSPVGCGEVHLIQVTASNEAGPSFPSSPVLFITCEYSRHYLIDLSSEIRFDSTLKYQVSKYFIDIASYFNHSSQTCSTLTYIIIICIYIVLTELYYISVTMVRDPNTHSVNVLSCVPSPLPARVSGSHGVARRKLHPEVGHGASR